MDRKMYRRMHDGPTHLPTGPRNYEALPKAKPRASLAALQWAADRANQSYGTFSLSLTPEDETRIQAEFDFFKQEREIATQSHRAEGNEVI